LFSLPDFPAMLMAHERIYSSGCCAANEFLNLENQKISTSRNWAIWLHEYLQKLPGKQDELRYVLTAIAPETSDSDFLWADYEARVNNELAAVFSNFVHRTMVLTQKNFEGKVPEVKQLHEGRFIGAGRNFKIPGAHWNGD